MLKIERVVQDGIVISSLVGELTIGPGVSPIRNEPREILAEAVLNGERVKMIIDLSQCADIDAAGLVELTRVCVAVVQAGGKVSICCPQSKLCDIIGDKYAGVWQVDENLPMAKLKMKRDGPFAKFETTEDPER